MFPRILFAMMCLVMTRAFIRPVFPAQRAMSLQATTTKPEITDVSVSTLRSMNLFDADGNVQNLESWCSKIPELRSKAIAGPVFISIGEGDQLKLFLEKNTYMPPELMLVDDYNFAAYNGAGLGKIGEKAALAVKGTRNMKAPKLKLKTWWSYLRNVGKLAPIPKNAKITSVPEGVTRLGATFGVVGNNVIYTYEDGVPGDHPDPLDVIKAFPLTEGKFR